ncbi:MAG: DNA mismatch repair endonuclease MutL [Candidatus Gastranaerophilales bacterium]|nr:DNA mismatch repair endonuclease MutL [Candidatus Gastranaerophilales bacterium]
MNRIKQLPVNLVNQIAAGEVIERPASVVKELVENSIDAQASAVEISISNDCRNIRIADNGIGIYPDDIELAFSKHATSKLTDEESLFNINTLGFRGEALASIISIAKVSCTTRTKDFDYGTKVESQNSVVKHSKTGCACGTIMEVNDLFFNQPVRLKFLKSAKTEFSYIQDYVQSLALSHPEIAFVLKNNDSNVLVTTRNSDLLTRITQIFSPDIVNELKEVNKSDLNSKINISGFISVPSFTRSSKKNIYTFVNSRMVKCPVLLKAIDSAYKNMLPGGKFPFVVININLPACDMDVNVHPSKKEIRYKNPNQIFSFVLSAISYALTYNKPADKTNFKEPVSQDATGVESFELKTAENYNITKTFDFTKLINPPSAKESELPPLFNSDSELKTEHTSYLPQKQAESMPEQTKMDINFEIPQKYRKVNVIGQYKNTYILVENEDNLEIIDQHIADERYIYEKLKTQKVINSQLLIVSDVLDIEPEDMEILEEARSHLEKFGYKIEKISETQIIFKKIPQLLSNSKSDEILAELIKNLKTSIESDLDTKEEKILITTACKAAIKAGDKLTLWQMEEIVKKLRTTKNPYTCPHGRPISHFISLKEIASFFDRNIK